MSDLGPGHTEDRGDDDPLALALALADEDARCGDYRQAIHALDAARALTGGVLPEGLRRQAARLVVAGVVRALPRRSVTPGAGGRIRATCPARPVVARNASAGRCRCHTGARRGASLPWTSRGGRSP